MSKGNSNPTDLSFCGENSRKSIQNKIKRAQDIRAIEEIKVTDYVACYTEDVNHILTRAGAGIVLGLEFEGPKNDNNNISLSKVDPIAADFVRSVIKKVKIANRMLKTFRLKLVIEEATA